MCFGLKRDWGRGTKSEVELSCKEKGGSSEARETGSLGLERFLMPTLLLLAGPGSSRAVLRSWAVGLDAHGILLLSVLSCRSWNNPTGSLRGGGLGPPADSCDICLSNLLGYFHWPASSGPGAETQGMSLQEDREDVVLGSLGNQGEYLKHKHSPPTTSGTALSAGAILPVPQN